MINSSRKNKNSSQRRILSNRRDYMGSNRMIPDKDFRFFKGNRHVGIFNNYINLSKSKFILNLNIYRREFENLRIKI